MTVIIEAADNRQLYTSSLDLRMLNSLCAPCLSASDAAQITNIVVPDHIASWIVYLHTGLGVIILPMVTFFDNFFLGGSSGMTRRRGQYFRTGMSQLEIGEQGEEVMNI